MCGPIKKLEKEMKARAVGGRSEREMTGGWIGWLSEKVRSEVN